MEREIRFGEEREKKCRGEIAKNGKGERRCGECGPHTPHETSHLVKGVVKWSEHRSDAANGFSDPNNAGVQLNSAQNGLERPKPESCGVCGPHTPQRYVCPKGGCPDDRRRRHEH